MNDHSNKDYFTAPQAMAMFQSLRNDISLVAEDVSTLRDDVTILKSDVAQLKTDMITVKDFIRIEFPALRSRVTALETKSR